MLLQSFLSAVIITWASFLLPGTPVVPAPTRVVVSGQLSHAPAGDTVRIECGAFKGKAPLAANGRFTIVLPRVAQATPASLFYARQHASLYLTPGDSLHLTLDFPRFDETIRFSGRGAAPNNYLAQSLWRFEFGPAGTVARPLEQRTPATTAAQMRALADAFRQKRREFLASYAKANPLTPAFQRDAALHIDLQWASSLLQYPQFRRDVQQPAVLPNTYFDFLRQLPLKKLDQYMGRDQSESSLTLLFLTLYGNRLLPTGTLSADPRAAQQVYAQATADLGVTAARDKAMFQLLSYQLDTNVAGVVAAMPAFRTQNRDSVAARDLRDMLRKQLRLQPGQPAPAFTLLNNEGKKVSLSDFRGKVVYLDFWGTWCGPCLAELPASAALRQAMAGRDVVFLYVSVGDTEEKWQQALRTHQLTAANAVQLRSPDNALATEYQVFSYPSHVLIGRDGRIRLTHAPTPSDQAAVSVALEKALRD